MRRDLSRCLYRKYFGLSNRRITVVLRNGRKIEGVFIGYYKGDEWWNEPYIAKWHLVKKEDQCSLGSDAFGFPAGELISQEEIAEVHFHEDNSVMKFKYK